VCAMCECVCVRYVSVCVCVRAMCVCVYVRCVSVCVCVLRTAALWGVVGYHRFC